MGLESIFRLSLIMNMVDNMTAPLSGVTGSVEQSTSRLQSMGTALGDMAKTGAAMSTLGQHITGAVLSPVEATFDTQKALGELSSLGVRDLDALENAARSFSDQWAGTTKADFITAAYDIKSGIASLNDEGVAGFTELAGITAKATKATTAEMTSLFASGYGIYRGYYEDLSDFEFGELFSAGIAESVRAFKTSGSGMANAIQSLGASATNANVPFEEQLAVLGMLQATMGGSEAGTKYNAFLRSAVKGGEALGLSFTDANDQLRALPEILDLLRGKYGDTIDAAEKMELQKAFGDTLSVQFIDLLYSKTDDLQDNILNLYDAMGGGISVATEMANAINETEPDRYLRLQQRIQNVKESIGQGLLPAINDLMSRGEGVLVMVSEWIDNHQELVRIIMTAALAVGGFLSVAGSAITVVGGVGLVFVKTAGMVTGFIGTVKKIPGLITNVRILALYAGDGIKKGFMVFKSVGGVAVSALKNVALGMAGLARQAITTVATAMAPLISSVWAFTASLLTSPITWIVIGIVALIAGIILLYNKCEWFRDMVNGIWERIKEGAAAVRDFFSGVFSGIAGVFGSVLGAARETVQEKLGNIKSAYEEHGGGIKGVAFAAVEGWKGIHTAGLTFLDNLTGGKLTAMKDKFADRFSGIRDAVTERMGMVRQFTSGTLLDMQDAYDAHGGGIQGIAAGYMAGLQSICRNGLGLLDDITGGRLSGIQAAYEAHGGGVRGICAGYMTALEGIFETGFSVLDTLTGGRLSAMRDTVSQGISTMKEAIVGKFSEFRDSGRKLMETFTEGIKGALSGPVDAVKGGLEKVRQLLPFSDAKEGPLSTLTLSGQRTMTTLAEGIRQETGAPARAVSGGLQQVDNILNTKPAALPALVNTAPGMEQIIPTSDLSADPGDHPDPRAVREKPGRVRVREIIRELVQEKVREHTVTGGEPSGGVHIDRVVLDVDLKKLKDLSMVLNLLRELEDYANSNGLETVREG